MRTAMTKKQASTFKEEGLRFGYESELLKTLQLFLKDIGADHSLSQDHETRLRDLKRFHEKLSVENYSFPEDIPFHVIYPRFFSAVVNKSVERKGNNVSELIGAFKKWVSVPQQVEKLREHFYKQHPEEQPKQLAEGAGFATDQDEAEINRLIKGKKVHEWPQEANPVILDQYKKLTGILFAGDEGKKVIESFGAAAYTHKIITEAQKRNLIS